MPNDMQKRKVMPNDMQKQKVMPNESKKARRKKVTVKSYAK